MGKRLVIYLASFLAAVLLAWLVVGLAGWSIPAGFLRASLTKELNEDLAPLSLQLEGPIRLTPTLTPTVRMARITVLHPAQGSRPAATLGSLSIKLSLAALFTGEVDLQKVTLEDLALPLEPAPGRKQGASFKFAQVSGRLRFAQDQARLEDLVLHQGPNTLTGRVLVDARLKPPRLVIALESPQVDVESLAQVVALGEGEARPSPQRNQAALAMLDHAVEKALQELQGELSLKVKRVRWREEMEGRGELQITLKNRRLAIERLEIGLPQGRIHLSNAIWPAEGGLASRLNLEVRNFSYGFLTSRVADKALRSQGRVSLRLALSSQAPTVSQLLAQADGVFQVGVWPRDLRTASFNLWAANLLFALLESLANKTTSRVNCVVGDFVMNQGVMTSQELIIDTSKVRVSGQARLDFRDRTIRVDLVPRAKQPQFFNLETPIQISGTFDQASAGVTPSGLVGSVIHFATSPVFAPLCRLFGHTLPAAGHDVCRAPQTWPPSTQSAETARPGE